MRVALVIGAGGGIGRAVAIALPVGWQVGLVGRRPGTMAETAALCDGAPLVLPCDVTDPAAVDAVFATLRARCGRLDLLFNNAGTNAAPRPIDK